MQTQTKLAPWLQALFAMWLCVLALPAMAQPGLVPLFRATLDDSFKPLLGQDASVYAVARQADGKIVIGGHFSAVNNVPRQNIARLNADGSTDPSFNPGLGADGAVLALAVQADGRVVIGGRFLNVDGTHRPYLARLEANGALDATFAQPAESGLAAQERGVVHALALQPDGKVVVGGLFRETLYNYRGVMRFLPGGERDLSFHGNVESPNAQVRALAALPDGKLLVGGMFRQAGGQLDPGGLVVRTDLVRLMPDGSVDAGFSANDTFLGAVTSLALQPDGRIVWAGYPFACDLVPVPGSTCMLLFPGHVGRLLADGQPDASFAVHEFWQDVSVVSLDPQGNVLVGGAFTTMDGTDRPRLTLLDASGAPLHGHSTFPTPDRAVHAALHDGKGWVIGGSFGYVSGQVRQGLAKVRFSPPKGVVPDRHPFYGRCGPAHEVPTWNPPKHKDLCASGTLRDWSAILWNQGGAYSWTCRGLVSSVRCWAPVSPP